MKWLLLFCLIMTAQLVYATNTVFIADSWKAGTYNRIKVETEINYNTGKITISDSHKNILLEREMNKVSDGVFDIIYFLPTNAEPDIYQVSITLDKNYYPEFNKTIEVKVIKINFLDKFILFLKTHIPFFK